MRLIFSAADLASFIVDAHNVLSAADQDDSFCRIAGALIRNSRLRDCEVADAIRDLCGRIPGRDLDALVAELDRGILLALVDDGEDFEMETA